MKSNKEESRLPESKPAFFAVNIQLITASKCRGVRTGCGEYSAKLSMLYDPHEKTAEHRALCRGTIYRAEEYV